MRKSRLSAYNWLRCLHITLFEGALGHSWGALAAQPPQQRALPGPGQGVEHGGASPETDGGCHIPGCPDPPWRLRLPASSWPHSRKGDSLASPERTEGITVSCIVFAVVRYHRKTEI